MDRERTRVLPNIAVDNRELDVIEVVQDDRVCLGAVDAGVVRVVAHGEPRYEGGDGWELEST